MSAKIPAKPAKPSKDTVYVDVDDEITSIIDKVENTKQKIVAVVLPKRASMLQSIVNMRLLKRSADGAGKSVVLITADNALLPLAGAAGLHVAKNLQSKPYVPPPPDSDLPETKEQPAEEAVDEAEEDSGTEDAPTTLDYHRTVGALAEAPDEEETIDLDNDQNQETPEETKKTEKAPKDKKLKIPNFERFRLMLIGGVVLFIGLIIFIVFAIAVLPKAKITVKTSSVPISADLSYTTSDSAKSLDEAKKIIPAVLKTTDQKSVQTVNASGQQNNGTKASGKVTLTNCGSSAVTIPAGTGISAGGLTYITQSSLSLSDGNFTSGGACKSSGTHVGTVNVISQGLGAKYNGSHGPYVISGFSSVSGADSGGMSGGTDNIITVVSQADLDSAKSKITSSDTDKFVKSFEDQLTKDGNYVLTSTLKPSDPVVTSTPSLGQPASSVSVNIKITYTVLVVSKADLTKAISDVLNKQVDQSKQKLSNSDVLGAASVTVQNQSSPTVATLNISEDTTAVPIINEANIKKQVGGLKAADIKSTISAIPGVKSVDVHMSPFWVTKAPKKPSKITVVQVQAQK